MYFFSRRSGLLFVSKVAAGRSQGSGLVRACLVVCGAVRPYLFASGPAPSVRRADFGRRADLTNSVSVGGGAVAPLGGNQSAPPRGAGHSVSATGRSSPSNGMRQLASTERSPASIGCQVSEGGPLLACGGAVGRDGSRVDNRRLLI